MENKHEPARKERYTPAQRITAVALAGAAFLNTSIGLDKEQPDGSRSAHAVVEQFVPRSTEGLPVSVGPEHTIIIPNEGKSNRIDWSVATPDKDSLRQKGEWCDTENVPLYQRATSEQLTAAAHESMGLSDGEFHSVEQAIDQAEAKNEAEAIVIGTYAKLGIKATFNEHKPYLITHDDVRHTVVPPEVELRIFKRKALDHLEALTIMPKEMAEVPDKVDFIEADHMATSKDKDGKEHGADGYFDIDTNGIVIRLGAGTGATIHEWAHALHRKACNGPQGTQFEDGEFKEAYDKAIRIVNSSHAAQRLEDKWPKDPNSGDEWISRDYEAATGFPTKYSRKSYGELMADLTTSLLMYGTVSEENGFVSDQAHELEQLAVERLQAATPNADIASLVAARSLYPAQLDRGLPIGELLGHRVSPIDGTYSLFYGSVSEDGGELRPAIRIRTADNQRDEYVYSYEFDHVKKPEGWYGGQYAIEVQKTGDEKFDKALLDMSIKYLQDRAVIKDITLEYEVREFDTQYFVQGSYLTEGVSEQKPKVTYTDYSEKGRVKESVQGKGGAVGGG